MIRVPKSKNSNYKIKSLITFWGLLLSILVSFFILWDRWKPKPEEILLEALPHIQTPFVVKPILYERGVRGPGLEIDWEPYFSITNLINDAIVIEDISVGFSADNSLDPAWSIVQRKYDLPSTMHWAYVGDDDHYFSESDSSKESLLQPGPFIIPPGSKKIIGFCLNFDLFKNKQKIIPTDSVETIKLVQRLIGGYIDADDKCTGCFGPVKVVLQIAPKRIVEFETETFLMVAGCTFNVYVRKHPLK
jgi:hypothetical protein